jgi:hypothetical protein
MGGPQRIAVAEARGIDQFLGVFSMHGQQLTPRAEWLDILHLSAIRTWQALASGQPAPDLDPDLEQVIYEAFVTSDGHYQVDQLCDRWLDLARQRGIAVDDLHGDLRPDVLDAISHTVSAAIWFGLTTGYMTLTGSYRIPRKFLLSSPGSGAAIRARDG